MDETYDKTTKEYEDYKQDADNLGQPQDKIDEIEDSIMQQLEEGE